LDVLNRIQELLDARGWSYYRLAKRMNKPVNTISDMFKRNTMPSIPTLESICDAFGITLSEFFADEHEAAILSRREKIHLSAYTILEDSEKDLADAYVFGLAKLPMDDPKP